METIANKVAPEYRDLAGSVFDKVQAGDRTLIRVVEVAPPKAESSPAEEQAEEKVPTPPNKKPRFNYSQDPEKITKLANSKKELVGVMRIENDERGKSIELDFKEIDVKVKNGAIQSLIDLENAKNGLELLKIQLETREIQQKLHPTPIKAMTLRQIAVKEGLHQGMTEQELNSTLSTLSKKFTQHRVGEAIAEGAFDSVYQYDHDAILSDFKREFTALRSKQASRPPNQPSINVYMNLNR